MRYDPFSPLPVAMKVMLLGPTGVGKTELAKALADEVYGDESRLIHISCPSVGTPNVLSEMLGAGPGYVGYESGGRLSEPLRRFGGAWVVLFDEIDKAHADLHRMLLSLIDDGYLTDARGNRIDVSQATIIATSNFGAEDLDLAALGAPRAGSVTGDLTKLPFDEVDQVLVNAARQRFCGPLPDLGMPELWGRWRTSVSPMRPITADALPAVIDRIISLPRFVRGPDLTIERDRTLRTFEEAWRDPNVSRFGARLVRDEVRARLGDVARHLALTGQARVERVHVAIGAAFTEVRIGEQVEVSLPATPMAAPEEFGRAS
jgi:ATP-dependent Clp protease ATP-binding subunit ClpA